jgi:hypothetical protein
MYIRGLVLLLLYLSFFPPYATSYILFQYKPLQYISISNRWSYIVFDQNCPRGIMSQYPLKNFSFSTVSMGSPPPSSRSMTVPLGSPPSPFSPTIPADIPFGTQMPIAPLPCKRSAPPPANNTPGNTNFGISLAEPDCQIILQLLIQFECMEQAMLSAQAANTN